MKTELFINISYVAAAVGGVLAAYKYRGNEIVRMIVNDSAHYVEAKFGAGEGVVKLNAFLDVVYQELNVFPWYIRYPIRILATNKNIFKLLDEVVELINRDNETRGTTATEKESEILDIFADKLKEMDYSGAIDLVHNDTIDVMRNRFKEKAGFIKSRIDLVTDLKKIDLRAGVEFNKKF